MLELTKEQTNEQVEFIKYYMNSSNAATGSKLDANANVSTKNIATMAAELPKSIFIQINRHMMTQKLTELFSKELADEYIRQVESHEIYPHDETSPFGYCTSITMYPFLENGLTKLGGESKSPKHLSSFCGSFVNLVFAVSSQFAGAVATVEWLMYFDYFARKDYGDNYLVTHKHEIENHLQHVVYAINQPAAARGYQSVFWNISLYDRPYFEAMFDNFVFPDENFTKPSYESLDKLQKFFMKWFNKEREKSILTFPVVTSACLVGDDGLIDKDYEDFVAEEYAEGNSFFTFMSKNAHALSSCCFSKDQKCLTRSSNGTNYMTFEELSKLKWRDGRKNLTIFHNGSWVKGKQVELPNRKMYKITTSNNKEIIVSDNHLNPTIRGDVHTDKLTTEDYLMFNTLALDAIPEKDKNLTYEQGFIIGAFLGDGSFGTRIKGTIYDINFSMSNDTHKLIMDMIDKVSSSKSCLSEPYNNVYPVRISDKVLVAFIQEWTNWSEGTKAHNKQLNLDCLTQSINFRKGILNGWYHTDGGNSNRCYTTSTLLAEHMEVLITSLGMQSIINISDRTDKQVIIRDIAYKRNYPLYCVRWYEQNNKRGINDVHKTINNSKYFKIKSIEEVKYTDSIFCFEMDNIDEPYFTLPNGIITHNCRLKNDVSDSINDFSYSLGAGGVATGSLNVITINYNRLIQDKRSISEQVEKIHKYQIAYRAIMQDYFDAGMLTVYDAGFISMDKQFLTIGVNGVLEAAEFLGLDPSLNDEYVNWVSNELKTISDLNKIAAKETGFKFNTEFVPAENLGVKFAKWDKADGYSVPRDCYNSYLYKVEDNEISILDKFALHGRETSEFLDGGSAYHCNLEETPTKETFKKLFKVAADVGCEYFCFNIKITICNECEHIDKRTLSACSRCESKDIDYGTRVIGYLKRVSAFSEARQKEASLRHYSLGR